MTAEQLEALSGGANPASVGMDCEEAFTHLARRVIAAEKLVEALEAVAEYPDANMKDCDFKRGWNSCLTMVRIKARHLSTTYREASK